MNQIYRYRIWKMVMRGLADKAKFFGTNDNEQQKQVIDPDEIIKGFKESIRKSALD